MKNSNTEKLKEIVFIIRPLRHLLKVILKNFKALE